MVDYVPMEKGTTIRQPATANLMIDSADRNAAVNPSPFDFQIAKNNSIMNGYFTRIGTSEVVLEWNQPNGAYLSSKGNVQMLVSSSVGQISTIVPNNSGPYLFYNSSNALNEFVGVLNSLSTTTGTSSFTISTLAGTPALVNTDPSVDGFQFSTCAYATALGVQSVPAFGGALLSQQNIRAPDLRPYRYIDFTSPQLTYNQDLKDSSTASIVRDVLCRWYFDWDNQAERDGYGFPIEMGYEPFKIRRLFNPPKQIRWDPRQPVGNFSFQVYGSGENAPIVPQSAPDSASSQFLMTLQISEN